MSAVADPSPVLIAHKFGGTSLATGERLAHVARLLAARTEPESVVVVSALKGTTDDLIDLATRAGARDRSWPDAWQALRQRHLDAAAGVRDAGRRVALCDALDAAFVGLRAQLDALAVLGIAVAEVLDTIQGLGEVFSAQLLQAYLADAGIDADLLDAREVLTVRAASTDSAMRGAIDWQQSSARLAQWRSAHHARHVVATGFIARDSHGRATTLGRNGSDYSGALFAALFEARELHIWTDVDGIASADPRFVPEAVTLDALSYSEAAELAYFGAKVLHPMTLVPVVARNIAVIVRNTFKPEHPGTRLSRERQLDPPVKGVSIQPQMAVVNIEGNGLIGVPGVAERVFGTLGAAGVSVVMISQGSSEHSICCVVPASDASRAELALRRTFADALRDKLIDDIRVERDIAVLAAVGEGMTGRPGVAARLFHHLARAGVNVRAIAQGASERNLSVAIAEVDATRALRAVHAGFWLSPQTVSLGLIGPGNVGRALLAQLASAQPRLREQAQLDLRLRGIANSRQQWRDDAGFDASAWLADAGDAEALNLDAFIEHLDAGHLPHRVLIDCSGNDAIAERYPDWLRRGLHIITPAKHAGSGPLTRYHAIRAACAVGGSRFRYEASVGAGLPVIHTLRDLLDTGDRLRSIEGVLSGTLAYLFNRYDGSQPFSALLREAHGHGYTEPDPRDDLGGLDVARKLVILAREAGHALELSDVRTESLVPETLRSGDGHAFLAQAEALDAPMAERLAAARASGGVLRYVARFDTDGRAEVGLRVLPADHVFGNLQSTDNCIRFQTDRYHDNPLVVQGPGAGPDVTAAGVFGDLLRLSAALGAKL